MSLILVGLLLPLEQASCHCQGQTLCQYFLSRVKTHLFSTVFSPPQLPPHQLFLSLSFPFPCIRLLFAALALPTDLISSYKCGCRHTHINTPVLPRFIGTVSFGFFFLTRFESFVFCETVPDQNKSPQKLWAQISYLTVVERKNPLKRFLIMMFYVQSSLVQSISANMISQIFCFLMTLLRAC